MADTEKTKVAEGTKVSLPEIPKMPWQEEPQQPQEPQGPLAPQEEEQTTAQRLSEELPWKPLQNKTAPVEPQQPQNKADEAAAYAKRLNAGELTGKTADGYKAGSFYTDFFSKNNPYQKRVEDAEEQMERMRRNKLFATIGSGFDAFHQAYANMRGVKPMESPKVADKYIAQYNTLKKDRDANQLAYTNAYMQAMRNDAADRLNADMMKFREKQAEETKRHNDAMESIYADRITAGQQKADKDRASREDIAEKNLASQEKRAAAKNATSMHNANIRYQNGSGRGGSGGKNDEYEKKTDKTYTKKDEWGGEVTVHEQKIETKKKGSGSSGGSSSGSKRALPKGSSSSSSGNSKKPLPKS